MIYIPFPCFMYSADLIDNATGQSMIREILQVVTDRDDGTIRTSKLTAKVWEGHTDALALYGTCLIKTDRARRHNPGLHRAELKQLESMLPMDPDSVGVPWWFGIQAVHISHKAALIKHDPIFYTNRFDPLKKIKDWPDIPLVTPHVDGPTEYLKAG